MDKTPRIERVTVAGRSVLCVKSAFIDSAPICRIIEIIRHEKAGSSGSHAHLRSRSRA
jgi:hypothetical protein